MNSMLILLLPIATLLGCKPYHAAALQESQVESSSQGYFRELKSPVRLYNWTSVARQDLTKLSIDNSYSRLSSA
ncbi:MAG: hypothetical protein WCI18_16180, partial [Pseudomonadota bacterium]